MARIGMKHPVWTPLVKETPGQMPTYGEGLVVGGAIAGTISVNRNNAELYADDALKENDNSATGGTISLEVDGITNAGRVAMMGYAENEDGSIDMTEDPSPWGGYGYVEVLSTNNVKSYGAAFVYKTQLAQSTIAANTRGQSANFGTTTLDGKMAAAVVAEDLKNRFYRYKEFGTLEEAIAWLDGLANVASV